VCWFFFIPCKLIIIINRIRLTIINNTVIFNQYVLPEFEECIAPPTSPRDIDYDNSELLALRIEKTREKLRKKYPTCNLPQITVIKQDENVLIKYDSIVNYLIMTSDVNVALP
jgi:hypothetical protein